MSNGGAGYLFFYSIILLSFSFMIWYVLYIIPDVHGLITKRHGKEAIALDPRGSYIGSSSSQKL